MPEEEITLREFLEEKFKAVEKDIEDVGKDVARLDGKYQEFERKNCSKHDLLFDKLSKIEAVYDQKHEEMNKEISANTEMLKSDNVQDVLSLYGTAKNLGIKLIVLLGLLGLIYMAYLIEIKK